MFDLDAKTIEHWAAQNDPKASADDVIRVERYLGQVLPKPYVEFISTYGFVEFPEWRRNFEYTIDGPSHTEKNWSGIAYLRETDRLIQAHQILTRSPEDPDDDMPKFPAHYLGIGQDGGEGEILIELGEHSGRIWYWAWDEWQWGQESNTSLGFVAEDLYSFVSSLKPFDAFL